LGLDGGEGEEVCGREEKKFVAILSTSWLRDFTTD
jgi:hypothetical protein